MDHSWINFGSEAYNEYLPEQFLSLKVELKTRTSWRDIVFSAGIFPLPEEGEYAQWIKHGPGPEFSLRIHLRDLLKLLLYEH